MSRMMWSHPRRCLQLPALTVAVSLSLLTTDREIAVGQEALSRQELVSCAEHYNQAVEHWNAGKIVPAHETLESLLTQHPGYFAAYSLYWDAVGRVQDEQIMLEEVGRMAEVLSAMPREQRTEDYFHAYLGACERLEQKDLEARLRDECIEMHPRGSVAQLALLASARAEEDPQSSAAKFQDYIDRFPENVSWVKSAARDRFQLIADHSESFSEEELVAAVDKHCETLRDFAVTYEQPSRCVMGLSGMAYRLLALDPELGREVLEGAVSYVQETAPEQPSLDESVIPVLLCIEVTLCAELGAWQEGCAAAQEVIPDEETGKAPVLPYWVPLTESELRVAYAECLLGLEDVEGARTQFAFAAHLDDGGDPALLRFERAHPIEDDQRTDLARSLKAFEESRTALRRERLEASQQCRPAPLFELADLAGESVALKALRGKIVILDFWATWCGPCVQELEAMKQVFEVYEQDESVEFVAVSTDSQKQLVAPFVEKNRYPYRVLLSDGTIEEPYGTQSIPQLYVVDAAGNIRFHKTGYDAKHFRQELHWMIELARGPAEGR